MKLKNPFRKKRKSVSIVTLNGMIATGRGLNDAGLAPALEKAFSKKPDAVALRRFACDLSFLLAFAPAVDCMNPLIDAICEF